MKKSIILGALAIAAALAVTSGDALARKKGSALSALDTDNDGTIDLVEANTAAEAVFARLEKDSDGTVDRKEVGSRISKKHFKDADADTDGTLTKEEYLALLAAQFKEADTDGEGTLDAKELRSKAGQAVLRLTR